MSIILATRDAFAERLGWLKFIIYAIPIWAYAHFYIVGNTAVCLILFPMLVILYFSLFTRAITNSFMNKDIVLTLNPLDLMITFFKSLAVLIPNGLVVGLVGYLLYQVPKLVKVPVPHFEVVYNWVIGIVLSILLFAVYLSFARAQKISAGFRYVEIFDALGDVLFGVLFFIPQIAIVASIYVFPVWYVFFAVKIPISHWSFVAYCSIVSVLLLSISAVYIAESICNHIKGSDDESKTFSIGY